LLGFFFLALMLGVAVDELFVDTNGRRKMPNAPDGVFEIHPPDESETLLDGPTGVLFQ